MRAAPGTGTERLPPAGSYLLPATGVLLAFGVAAPLLVEWNRGLLDSWYLQSLAIAGAICAIICCMLSLHSRARAEAALLRAEAQADAIRLQLLDVERVGQIGHWISCNATRTVVWSPQIFAIAGIPSVPAMAVTEAQAPIHPDDLPAFVAIIKDALRSGQTRSCEHRWMRPDGGIRWVQINVSARYDATGTWSELLGTVRDITERKAAEASQKNAQQQLIDAIEAISEGFVLWDKNDRFVLANKNFRQLWPLLDDVLVPGTPFETVSRIAVERGVLDIGDENIEDYIRRTIAWHRTCGELDQRKLGNGHWLLIAERRTRDGGIVGIRTDITAQVTAQQALREALREAQAASHAKSEFLANMSHELRTPLNGIIGFSEMIKFALKGPLPLTYQEYGGLIHQSGEHLLAVINDILDLAKVDAGKFDLRREEGVDPRQIAEACVTLVRGHADTASIELSLTASDPLPALVADPTRLKQILLNLLSNAIKFTKPGGSVRLAVRRSDDGGVAFEVRDTGAGMTPREVEIALEPFGQVRDSTLHAQEGTGLGLPLARRFAELHGGSLRIDTEKGRGTMVTVLLPAALAENSEPRREVDSGPPPFSPQLGVRGRSPADRSASSISACRSPAPVPRLAKKER